MGRGSAPRPRPFLTPPPRTNQDRARLSWEYTSASLSRGDSPKPLLNFEPQLVAGIPRTQIGRSPIYGHKKPATNLRRVTGLWRLAGSEPSDAYCCHERFLWRWDFKRLRRLCLFIFKRRFFFRLPMVLESW